MRLELENLEKVGNFEHVYRPEELPLDEGDLRLIEPVSVSGRLLRSAGEIEIAGELRTRVETPCARCLKTVAIPIRADFSERFVTAVSWRSEEQHELASEDLNLAVFEGDAIDLDHLVREEILLEVPAQVLCRQECRGLCPVCSLDRNASACECEARQIDPRWAKLKELQS